MNYWIRMLRITTVRFSLGASFELCRSSFRALKYFVNMVWLPPSGVVHVCNQTIHTTKLPKSWLLSWLKKALPSSQAVARVSWRHQTSVPLRWVVILLVSIFNCHLTSEEHTSELQSQFHLV